MFAMIIFTISGDTESPCKERKSIIRMIIFYCKLGESNPKNDRLWRGGTRGLEPVHGGYRTIAGRVGAREMNLICNIKDRGILLMKMYIE